MYIHVDKASRPLLSSCEISAFDCMIMSSVAITRSLKLAENIQVNGERFKGRPKKRWPDTLDRRMKSTTKIYDEDEPTEEETRIILYTTNPLKYSPIAIGDPFSTV